MRRTSLYILLGTFLCIESLAQDVVTAGAFVVELATLHNLGFEWSISGDQNRNATVAVAYGLLGMPLIKAFPCRISTMAIQDLPQTLEHWNMEQQRSYTALDQ